MRARALLTRTPAGGGARPREASRSAAPRSSSIASTRAGRPAFHEGKERFVSRSPVRGSVAGDGAVRIRGYRAIPTAKEFTNRLIDPTVYGAPN